MRLIVIFFVIIYSIEYNNSRFEMLVLRKTKPRKNNKSKSKKQRTFTSSEFSLP